MDLDGTQTAYPDEFIFAKDDETEMKFSEAYFHQSNRLRRRFVLQVNHDTAEFVVESIRHWWYQMGHSLYPRGKYLLITADCGGSNGNRHSGGF